MKNSIDKFEIELDGLLKRYFNDDQLSLLKQNINPPKEESDNITGMINNFYKNQSHIKAVDNVRRNTNVTKDQLTRMFNQINNY